MRDNDLEYFYGLLRDNIESQITSLERVGETSWDCKDVSNWESMLDCLDKLKLLVIKGKGNV